MDVTAGVTQEEGHTGLLHLPSAVFALIFLARRIQPFLFLVDREVYGHTYGKSMDQPDKVANPARGQLNRKNVFFPVRVYAWEFGLARRVRQSHPASACSSPYSG